MFGEDKILIKELKNGNEGAYKYLYDVHYKNLVVYCLKLTNKLPLAKDIVQDTLINMWVNRETITINSSLKNYLYRSVFNAFASEYRKNRKEEIALLEVKNEILNNVIDLDDELLKKKMKLLEMAIEKLPKKCKEVFLLNKKQGYRYKEIAAHLGISEKAVEKHISRAIGRLKKSLHSKRYFVCMLLFGKIFTLRNAV